MKKLGLWCGLLLPIVAAACWSTKPNPLYCESTCADPLLECDTTQHQCVERGTAPDLSTTPDMTVTCEQSSECKVATAPICDAHVCRACHAGDCSAPKAVCLPSGACAECMGESDCAATQQVCADTMCVACVNHADCTTGICDAGKCAKAADIVYVNNASCVMGDGSAAKPLCQVNEAIATGKKYVKVAGSAMAYNAISVTTAVDVVVVGPGKNAAVTALVKQAGSAAATVNPNADATLILDGLELVGESVPARAGVQCLTGGAAANLTVRDSYVHASGAAGIDAKACTLSVQRSLISMNQGGGLSVGTSPQFVVENNLFVQNASTSSAAVTFDNGSVGTFRFNTIANNATTTAGVAAGIACGSVARVIDSSIVFGNTKGTTSQLEGNCTLTNTVTGGDSAVNAIQLSPEFAGASDFRLKPSSVMNKACCVDKATATATLTVDVDNTKRPKGNGYDIGAHEVE